MRQSQRHRWRHVHPSVVDVLDLKSLYQVQVQKKALTARSGKSSPLYPLYASEQVIRDQLEQLPEELRRMYEIQQTMSDAGYQYGATTNLLSTQIITTSIQLLE